ncbi:MAG: aspartate aminotransferase family protein [Granulosicoccus sp.]|nr:aspartate aminotransferase family protein [Granulosicoccus sp.]
MKSSEYRQWSQQATEWSAEYLDQIETFPVRAQTAPGDIAAQIAEQPPEHGESMDTILDDFKRIVPPGMTHWQHPRFFAYFSSNAAPAAMIAEQLAGTMAAQCMLWQTSPAATEMEVRMVDWLRQAVGLPDTFSGVLQDTASSATLCAILTMRETALNWAGNQHGLSGQAPLRIYASTRTHSSIDKAMWIAGLGQDNLVKIPTTKDYAMDENTLAKAIREDRKNGLIPAGIVICVGGTSMGATDQVDSVCELAESEGLYTHVDAAWAGSAMICPEYRELWRGVERADSIVLNPHKWLGAPMECSAHFVKNPDTLVKTLAIQPEYLKTHGKDGVVNFSEWSVQLGRRFRALKLWFLLRAYGLEGLRTMIRNHVNWGKELCNRLEAQPDFEITTQPILSLFTFRYKPQQATDDLDALNLTLLKLINDDGRIYLTQTIHDGQQVIRFVCGQFEMRQQDIDIAFDVITSVARSIKST